MPTPNTSNDWDEDVRIGVPTAGRAAPAGPPPENRGFTPPARPDPDPSLELREGETELGRPQQKPSELALLSDEDRATLRRLEEEQAARDIAEAELLLAADPSGLGWLGWFGSPLAFAFLVGMAGLAGLFVFNQVLSVLNTLAAQPPWAQYAGYGGLVLLGGCVLFAALRLAVLYARLRRNRQLRIRGLEELARRTRLRWLAAAKSAEAKEQAERYLREYPLDSEKDRRALARLGLTDDAQMRLVRVREELLDPGRFASTAQWFTRFRDGFQAELDAAADARVRYWASRIWVITAVAPNAVVDTGATLFYTFSMLADLCRVYNLRAGRTGTAVLLGRVFFNAYLAGQGTEWEKLAEDQYDQLFHEAMGVVGMGVGANVAGKLLGKVGAKATTGYLNRVLLIRLGRYAVRLLRPVSRD
jgi:putative membrane protein